VLTQDVQHEVNLLLHTID